VTCIHAPIFKPSKGLFLEKSFLFLKEQAFA